MNESTEIMKSLSEVAPRIHGASYEYPGFLSVTICGVHYAFGDANGPLGYDYGPAAKPGEPRTWGGEEIPSDSSVEEVEAFIRRAMSIPRDGLTMDDVVLDPDLGPDDLIKAVLDCANEELSARLSGLENGFEHPNTLALFGRAKGIALALWQEAD